MSSEPGSSRATGLQRQWNRSLTGKPGAEVRTWPSLDRIEIAALRTIDGSAGKQIELACAAGLIDRYRAARTPASSRTCRHAISNGFVMGPSGLACRATTRCCRRLPPACAALSPSGVPPVAQSRMMSSSRAEICRWAALMKSRPPPPRRLHQAPQQAARCAAIRPRERRLRIVRSDIGPTPPSTWQRPQRFRKIG